MYCPNCGREQWCPCESCSARNKEKVTWCWTTPNSIQCGYCGHTMSADEWSNEEQKQIKDPQSQTNNRE